MNEKNPVKIQKSTEALFRKLRTISFIFIVLTFLFFVLGLGLGWNYILTICLMIGCMIIAFILPFSVKRIRIKRDMELVKLMHLEGGGGGRI